MSEPAASTRTAFRRRDLLPRRLPGGGRYTFEPEAGPAGDVLVVIFLRGGMDGLHTVPAYADPDYRSRRPTLALAEPGTAQGVLDLDGRFGLHPALSPLRELFQEQRLAVVHACGSPDQSLSHFEAMQTMERGVSDGGTTATGWIARHLATLENGNPSPVRAIAIGDTLPKSMQGAIAATSVRSITEYRLQVPPEWKAGFSTALAALYSGGDDLSCRYGRTTLKLLGKLEKLDPASYRPGSGAVYPDKPLGSGLKQVAQLLKADLGLEIAEVDLGGWDAHAAQPTLMQGLMEDLGASLHAFFTDLAERSRRVTIVAMSEFGRRVHENTTLGTDHGRGTAMFVLGGSVRGGRVYGQWPGLGEGELDRDGNLRVTTDYRDVLCELVARRLGNPRWRDVFPDHEARPLDLVS